MAKVRAITAEILKYRGEDYSNRGLSSRFDEVYVICEDGNHVFDSIEETPENTVRVVERHLFGRTVYHCEPVHGKRSGCVGWMAGGCYVSSSDSRFSAQHENFYGALSLHDRQETQELYDMLSR